MKSEELWYKFVCRRGKHIKARKVGRTGLTFALCTEETSKTRKTKSHRQARTFLYVTDGGLMFDTVLKF